MATLAVHEFVDKKNGYINQSCTIMLNKYHERGQNALPFVKLL